jgi:hypothetical protein
LSTGAKIAIGCGIVLLVGIIGVTVAVVGGVYWAKGKVEAVADDQKKITELQERANANPFTRPADSVVAEDRLLKFLEVRKRVLAVYQKHETAIQSLKNKKDGDLSDLRHGYNVLNELRLALAQAQADEGMSDSEYEFLMEQLYRSRPTHEAARPTVDGSPSPGAGEGHASDPDIPAANVELFRKYETEIRKYTMVGLDWMGL